MQGTSYLDHNGALILGTFRPSYFKPYVSSSSKADNHSMVQDHHEPIFDNGDDHFGYADDGGANYDWNDNGAAVEEPLKPVGATNPTAQISAKQNVNYPQSKPAKAKAFELLDPHQVVNGSRPAKKGRPFKMPKINSGDEFASKQSFLDSLSKKRDGMNDFMERNIPLKGLFEPSLMPLLQLKRKIVRRQRLEKYHQNAAEAVENLDPARFLHPLDQSAWDEPEYVNDYIGGGDMGGMDNYYDDHHDAPVYDVPEPLDDNYATDRVLFPTDDIAAEIAEEEELHRRVDAALNEELNKSKANSYEMICRQYIEGFHRGANAFARYSIIHNLCVNSY